MFLDTDRDNVQVLDLRGLVCPMPVLKTKKALSSLSSGQRLLVFTSDPASKTDIPALLNRLNSRLVELKDMEGTFSFLIEKR